MVPRNSRTSRLAKFLPLRPTRAEFIRHAPPFMMAREVVAAGADAGLVFSEAYVYKVRSWRVAKEAAMEDASKKPPRAKKAKRPGAKIKADYVRRHPGVPSRELVAKAEAVRLGLTAPYVSIVRRRDRMLQEARDRAAEAEKRPAGSRGGARSIDPSVARLLRAAAVKLGLDRAIRILMAERARRRGSPR